MTSLMGLLKNVKGISICLTGEGAVFNWFNWPGGGHWCWYVMYL